MKFTFSFCMVVLLVSACRQHTDSADEKIQKELSGTWTFEARYRSHTNEQRLTVAPDGNYVFTINIPPRRTNGPRIVRMEGTMRVEGGFLVDTITKDSQNYISVPSTNRNRIIRIDGRELVLDYEREPDGEYPTNPIVYLKQTK